MPVVGLPSVTRYELIDRSSGVSELRHYPSLIDDAQKARLDIYVGPGGPHHGQILYHVVGIILWHLASDIEIWPPREVSEASRFRPLLPDAVNSPSLTIRLPVLEEVVGKRWTVP